MIATRALVEGLTRTDGSVDCGELYAVANIIGMTDQQVRLCIKRLVAEGRYTAEGRGRQAVLWAASSTADEVEFVRFAYRQDKGLEPWDRRWRLVAFAVPETERAARDRFRDAISFLGGAPVQSGLYVSANDWHDLIAAQARQLGIQSGVTHLTSTDLQVGRESDPGRLAALLWPLAEIAQRHRRLADLAEARLTDLEGSTQVELLAMAVELAAAFTEAMEPDPLLPPELLPQPWPGTLARALTARFFQAARARDQGGAPIQLFRQYHL